MVTYIFEVCALMPSVGTALYILGDYIRRQWRNEDQERQVRSLELLGLREPAHMPQVKMTKMAPMYDPINAPDIGQMDIIGGAHALARYYAKQETAQLKELMGSFLTTQQRHEIEMKQVKAAAKALPPGPKASSASETRRIKVEELLKKTEQLQKEIENLQRIQRDTVEMSKSQVPYTPKSAAQIKYENGMTLSHEEQREILKSQDNAHWRIDTSTSIHESEDQLARRLWDMKTKGAQGAYDPGRSGWH
jgi:hypothetical protein